MTPEKARRRMHNVLERGFRRAAEQSERIREKDDKLLQRARYNRNAADSPTPPPKKSLRRDGQCIEIFKFIEAECSDVHGAIVVNCLAEKFLFEQGSLDPNKAEFSHESLDDLMDRLMGLATGTNPDLTKKLSRRIKFRSKFLGKKSAVRVYGWDKCTMLLRSCFISWSMSPARQIPFSVNLSEKSIVNAKAAKVSFASHLQARLQKLLKRAFDEPPAFWFAVEHGSKSGFHLHGSIECDVSKTEQDKLKSALTTLSGLSDIRAVKLSAPGSRFGWAEYVLKHSVTTKKFLGEEAFASTRSAARNGRAMYKDFQELVRQKAKW